MPEYPPEITQRFHGTPEQMAIALVGDPPRRWASIVLEEYDPAWVDRFVSSAEDVHLHVWPRGAPEPVRHRLFRDWLRSHPEDRERYAEAKHRLAGETADQPGDYSLAKNAVIDDIYVRIFAAPGP